MSGEVRTQLVSIAYNNDPDEAQQNAGPHMKSKLFDTQIETSLISRASHITVHLIKVFQRLFGNLFFITRYF